MLNLENVGLAVEISFLSHLEAEIKVFPVWRPPYWIFHFRFGSDYHHFFLELPDILNTGFSVKIVFLSCLQAYMLIVPVYRSPSWIFHFRLHLAVFPLVPLEWPLSKMGVAVGILLLSHREVEICLGVNYPPWALCVNKTCRATWGLRLPVLTLAGQSTRCSCPMHSKLRQLINYLYFCHRTFLVKIICRAYSNILSSSILEYEYLV